jgi:flagellar M-ring protein FliF
MRAWIDRAASVWQRLPLAVKLAIGAVLATGVLIAAYFALEPMLRDDAVLYSQLDGEDAGQIVEKLKADKIPFKLTGDGTTIRVPADTVHEIRLSLAAEGLPRGGSVGFETFQKLRLGATEFEQQVTYRRAMEGELARTISTVRSVKSARVHLVLPKKSVFAQRSEPASASVVLKLSGGMPDGQEVSSIVSLVASAVAGLEPSRITLVTTTGKMLHRPSPVAASGDGASMGAAEADQMAQTKALEAQLEERTRTLLERVLGMGHVDVRVRAAVDTARVERKSDTFNPAKTAIRSEQQLVETNGQAPMLVDTVAGVPGVQANLPGPEGAEQVAEAGAQGSLRRSHTRNFEIDRVTEHRVSVSHIVKRLAVAVIVDGVAKTVGDKTTIVPRERAELDKLETLVRSAVGFDEDRGDVVTIESLPFFNEEVPAVAEAPTMLPIPEPYRAIVEKYLPLAKAVGMGLAGLITLLWLRRKLSKWQKERDKHVKQIAAARRAAALEAAAVSEIGADEIDYRTEALRRAKEDPSSAALVMRHWLGTLPQKQERAA